MTDKNNANEIDNNNTDKPAYGPKIDRATGRIEFTDSYTEYMDTFRKAAKDSGYDDADTPEKTHSRRSAKGSGRSPHKSARRSERHTEVSDSEVEERRMQRRIRQHRRRRIIALCTVVIAVAVIVMFVLGQMNTAYDNENDFEGFANQKFRKMHVLPDTQDRLITYQYGETTSFAYRYDPSDNEDLVVFRDQQIEDLKEDFEKSVKKQIRESGENGKKGLFRNSTNYAMLFDSAVYDTGNGALSMAIYSVEYQEIDGKMKPVQASVQTYLLNANTLLVVHPIQLLTPEYKEKAAVFCTEYLNKTYKEDQILPDAQQYLKEDDSNYNQIILENGDLTVFFDEGTVVDAGEGVIAITIPRVYMGTSVRSSIISRYVRSGK